MFVILRYGTIPYCTMAAQNNTIHTHHHPKDEEMKWKRWARIITLPIGLVINRSCEEKFATKSAHIFVDLGSFVTKGCFKVHQQFKLI